VIASRQPDDWRALQHDVAQIFDECGFAVDIEKPVTLARGQATVDVYAEENIRGRTYRIFCECKRWKSSIPQSVIHGFRTVVADGGANVGYVITSSAFQTGAFAAADLTNIRLVSWAEFQEDFEKTWIDNHLRQYVTDRLDSLLSYVEPILPRAFDDLDDDGKRNYIAVRDRYFDLGALVMLFTTHVTGFFPEIPDLPLRSRFKPSSEFTVMPTELLDATAYRDFLDVLIPLGERAIAELRVAIGRTEETPSSPNGT